jgi:RsiW-degrading membrane proteinase PrsW (M82 family)
MKGIGLLFLLIGLSALPALALCIWIKVRAFPVTIPGFLLALGAGFISLALAALLQAFIPTGRSLSVGGFIYRIFFHIAFTEEFSRLVILVLFLTAALHFKPREMTPEETAAYGALTGLIAGMGFAVLETAFYGAANFAVALIRAVTAAPLHGACGARIGFGAVTFRDAPGRAFGMLIYAAIIHGAYNFLLIASGRFAILAVIVALSALFAALRPCRIAWKP